MILVAVGAWTVTVLTGCVTIDPESVVSGTTDIKVSLFDV